MFDPQGISLTLSGGGFRATLFHLGVIRFLYESGLLSQVEHISAVSGGSVLAAHLALNWDRYTGSYESFDSAAQEVVTFVRSDVRGRVIRRWILAWLTVVPRMVKGHHWTFTNLLQAEYKQLYGNAKLKHLRGKDGEKCARPEVFLNCTSLNTGFPCCFGSSGFIWYENNIEKTIAAPETDLSFAVASSSAFPPLFPPIVVSHDVLSCDRKHFPNPFYLTDGGVYDNLGIDRLLWQRGTTGQAKVLLISDAEGNFDWNFDTTYTFITGRNIRASNLMMKRVSDLEYMSLSNLPCHAVSLKIGSETQWLSDKSGLSPEIQRQLRNIRTDLDAFSPHEIKCLIQHGFAVAQERAKANNWVENTAELSWSPLSPLGLAAATDPRLIRKATVRKSRLWSYRDWVSWVSAIVLLVTLLAVTKLIGTLTRKTSNVPLKPSLTSMDRQLMRVDVDAEAPFSRPALSADGLRIVFVSHGQLAVRFLGREKTRILPETQGANYPFFSPDGRWVGFFANGKLKKVAVEEEGTPITLCDAPSARGGTWAEDGSIVAALNPTGGLSRVSAEGGTPELLTNLTDQEDIVDSHRWPQALPGGGLLFAATIQGRHGSLRVLLPGGKRSLRLIENATYGRYVKSGHIIFYQGGTLFAASVDLASMKVGPTTPLLVGVAYDRVTGQADFDVSDSGTLVYRSGKEARQTVTWVDSNGVLSPLVPEAGDYSTPRLSPDGNLLALAVEKDGRQNLWIYSTGQDGRRLTFDRGPQTFPLWTPDGEYLTFESASTLAWTRSEGGKPVDLLKTANRSSYPWSFTPDGKLLAFTQAGEQSGWDIWTAPVERTLGGMRIGPPRLLDLKEEGVKTAPAISPDGKWLAYVSTQSGRNEVYVCLFSDPAGGKWQISNEGGLWPIWAREGHNLFYENLQRQIVAVSYAANGNRFIKQRLQLWSKTQLAVTGNIPAFDVARDGKRVAALLDTQAEDESLNTHIRLLLNVDAELYRKDATANAALKEPRLH